MLVRKNIMERTIRVTGKGKLAVKPDLIELTLSIKDIKKNTMSY